MRRLIAFPCMGETLGGSLDPGARGVGLLIVTGGTQVRVGAHRVQARLADFAAARGFPAFRFDRRGVGDSGGEDPSYLDSGPDVRAALEAFRREQPHVGRVVGVGICDGATSLALHASALGLAGLVLANPWLVEAEADAPAPAAVRQHYRDRLLDADAWARLLRGGVNLRRLLGSLRRAAADTSGGPLADRVAAALGPYPGSLTLLLSTGDNTARAARACWTGPAFGTVATRADVVDVPSDSHTFARPGDFDHLAGAVLATLERV